eukprot:4828151-Pyramimonas_sp.AAC.1
MEFLIVGKHHGVHVIDVPGQLAHERLIFRMLRDSSRNRRPRSGTRTYLHKDWHVVRRKLKIMH